MSGRIYFLNEDGELRPLDEAPYAAEDILQALLANHPDLLAGEQLRPESPRRWLLIDREIGIPGEEGGSGRWALDHLFLDQDGVPTLVEVKRASDTRSRREVVAQMLDYAANAVTYWPLEQLVADFERRRTAGGADPSEVLSRFVGLETEVSEFWQRVKTNLRAGRVRMLFVADQIPHELQRIVEFLNEQMDPAEVYAVEVRQFAGDPGRVLVPRLIGDTAAARDRRTPSRKPRQWDEQSFFEDLANRYPDLVDVARTTFDWAVKRGGIPVYGRGSVNGTCTFGFEIGGFHLTPFSMYSGGYFELRMSPISQDDPAFREMERRLDLIRRLNGIPDVYVPDNKHDGWPQVRMGLMSNPTRLAAFLDVWDWYLAEIRDGAV